VNYLEEPELPNLTEQELIYIFNAAKFTISRLGNRSIYGVKADYLYFALGRVSKMLECYKTARICYDKIL
jgi:intraflagellar transport protein 122